MITIKKIGGSLLIILSLIHYSGKVNAQPGSLDMTFNPGDVGYDIGCGPNGEVYVTRVDNSGKIYVGGYFSRYNNIAAQALLRLTVDGRTDNSFITEFPAYSSIYDIAIQDDGKVLAGGYFTSYSATTVKGIVRLNSDGSIDNSFQCGSGVNGKVYTIALQSDNKILIGGNFTSYNGTSVKNIVRLNSDGTIDSSFQTGTGADSTVYKIALQNDGKILVGGGFSTFNGITQKYIIRLLQDGSIDSGFSFSLFTESNQQVNSIFIQPDGKIVIGGKFSFTIMPFVRINIIRLNTNGELDTDFIASTTSSLWIGFDRDVKNITGLSDEKLLINGYFKQLYNNNNYTNCIAILNTDGSIDTTFKSKIKIIGLQNRINSAVILNNNKILFGGNLNLYGNIKKNNLFVTDLHGDLYLDFNYVTGSDDYIECICPLSNGKILISGAFTQYNGKPATSFGRINGDGSLDTTFNIGLGLENPSGYYYSISGIKETTNNKVYILGEYTKYNGTTANRIARIQQDGSLDTSFVTGTGFNNFTFSLEYSHDNKLIVYGDFTQYNQNTANRIICLYQDGTVDPTFNTGSGFNDVVYILKKDNTNKYYAGGNFSTYNGYNCGKIVRINSDGSIDNSFQTGTGADDYILGILPTNDGKVILTGWFNNFNGTPTGRIVRLNQDGSIDTSFQTGIGCDNNIVSSLIQQDGKIIIAGAFNKYDNIPRTRIARLNPNGSIDNTFDPGLGVDSTILYLEELETGNLLISGFFLSYDNHGRNRIARIYSGELGVPEVKTENIISVYPNPASNFVNIEFSLKEPQEVKIEITDAVSRPVLELNKKYSQGSQKCRINTASLAKGTYLLKVTFDGECVSKKLVKE